MHHRDARAISQPQRETLDAIARMQKESGMTPTLKELGKLLGVTTTAVRQRLGYLERAGRIIRHHRVARGIVLVKH